MPAVKSLALSVLVGGMLATAAHADSMAWTWTSWSPTEGVILSNMPGGPNPFIPLSWGPNSLAQPTDAQTSSQPPAAPVVSNSQSPSAWAPGAAAPAAGNNGGTVDAFVNLGTGPYPAASQLTTGNAQPWYDSSAVTQLFGGVPNAQQRSDFTNAVIQRVEKSFQLGGVPISLTADPTMPAAHTLSVVSNTSNGTLPTAIGMTNLGGNGFSYIDQIAPLARSVDQLEWIVAHNVSHELMIAFGVGENHDQTGNYIDSRVASWSMMVDPNATFSQGAAQELLSKNFLASSAPAAGPSAQLVPAGSSAVPEPGTLVLWTLAGGVLAFRGRKRLVAARG
ncbi:MAG TPA: PEP-CTERM sorting domain-containing protein [Isosphaeraceae bacterium]|jgi:hypothetical protein|nr:PEP-CTERM sorting domain-containing protein [Isosphaeraceae bacterium]